MHDAIAKVNLTPEVSKFERDDDQVEIDYFRPIEKKLVIQAVPANSIL